MATLLFAACSKSSNTQVDEETTTWYEQIYFNITRSDISEDVVYETYNFTLFGDTNGNTYYSGTYRMPTAEEDNDVLYPCEVDPITGLYDNYTGDFDSSFGLSAPAGSYQIVVTSPAVAVTSNFTDHTSTKRSGFKIERHIDDNDSDAVDLFIKGPRDVTVSGVEINGEKEYTSSSVDLSRPRSKFVLYIRSADEAKSYSVYDVYFDNLLTTGYYNPTVGYYRTSSDLSDLYPYRDYVSESNYITATSTSQMLTVSDDCKTTVTNTSGETLEAIYLIANDCSDGESTYVAVPHLVIKLNRNGEDIIEEASVVTIPLEYEFERSYYYEFTITISPVNITLSGIKVAEWIPGGGDEIYVENLTPLVFDYNDVGDWEEGYGGDATFN